MKTFLSRPKLRLALISLALAILLAFLFLIPRNQGAFRAIPSQTSLLLHFHGLVQAGQQLALVKDPAWKQVLKSAIFQNNWKEIGDAERLFHHDAGIRAAFAKNELLAAYALHPADSLHAVFILELEDQVDLRKILETNKVTPKFFPYQFHSQTLYTVYASKNEQVVVAQKGRLLIFSRYSYLVEDALTQTESTGGWWSDNKYLGDLDPEAAFRLFFRPSKWLAQQEGSLVPAARYMPKTVADNVAWLGIAWNGQQITALCEPLGFFAGIRRWNGAPCSDIFNALPGNTAFFAWAGFDNNNLFFESIANQQSNDFEHFVLPWVGQEAAMVVTEPLSAALTDDRLLVLAVRDSARARESLTAYGQTRGLLAHEQVGMFDVFGFQDASLLKPLLARDDQAFQNPFVVLLGKYLVVAPNRPAIEVFIEKYIGNQTLAQNTDFLQLVQSIQQKERAVMVLNGGYLTRMLQQLFREDYAAEHWEDDAAGIARAGWLSATFTPGFGRKFEVHFAAQAQTERLPASNIYWKTALAAPAVTGVFTVAQPEMATGTAILLQDKQTELYCLKPDGAIAWQKHLGNYIISAIHAIDFYQNGRKCYLFNTGTQVWILDENGKEVQGYPLSLKAAASAGLTVVDFDKNLKFNFFVPCENGHYYGFDLYGRALDGWNPQMNTGKTAGPLLHFQHQGKDYLSVLNSEGLLSVFGRDGKPRFEAVKLEGSFATAPIVDKSTGKPRIICLNTDGKLFDCDLTRQYRSWQWNSKKSSAAIKSLPWAWSTAQGIAVLQGKQLDLLKLGATIQRSSSRQLPDSQDDLFELGDYLGFCARNKRKITLIDKEGKVVKGFPLAGSTPFGICTVGQQKIIVTGNGSAVYAYKLTD